MRKYNGYDFYENKGGDIHIPQNISTWESYCGITLGVFDYNIVPVDDRKEKSNKVCPLCLKGIRLVDKSCKLTTQFVNAQSDNKFLRDELNLAMDYIITVEND